MGAGLGWLGGLPRLRTDLDGNGHQRRAIVQVDILQSVLGVVITAAIDVVIFHEKHRKNPDIRDDLAVRGEKRT